MRWCVRVLAAALLAAAATSVPVRAEGPAPGAAAAAKIQVGGRWTGAKLRCQKEEGKLVRCGTPAAFEISFAEAGTGTTPDEVLPGDFSWRWLADQEIGITPRAGGEEIRLFGVEQEEPDILTFQAYVYLPTADPNAPAEARYIHYIFDVNRTE